MKKIKGIKENHTSNQKIGMGDFYGPGIKNPIGKIRDGFGSNPLNKKKLGKPPKSLA